MALPANIQQFKSSGVYRLEFDKSQLINIPTETIRLVIGYSNKGPFNTPIFVPDVQFFKDVFGDIDNGLELKGSYFHRSCLTALDRGPIIVLNLLKLDDSVTAEFRALSSASDSTNHVEGAAPVSEFFNQDKFWFIEDDSVISAINQHDGQGSTLFNLANAGKKTVSVFVTKSSVNGFDISAEEWYGSGNVPPFLDRSSWISDFLVRVIVLDGDFSDYQALSIDPIYGDLFDTKGLKANVTDAFGNSASGLDKLLQLPEVTTLAEYTGSLIPEFIDKDGTNLFIEDIVNNETSKTGLVCAINGDWYYDNPTLNAMVDGLQIDLIGHGLELNTNGISTLDFLSYYGSLNALQPYLQLDYNHGGATSSISTYIFDGTGVTPNYTVDQSAEYAALGMTAGYDEINIYGPLNPAIVGGTVSSIWNTTQQSEFLAFGNSLNTGSFVSCGYTGSSATGYTGELYNYARVAEVSKSNDSSLGIDRLTVRIEYTDEAGLVAPAVGTTTGIGTVFSLGYAAGSTGGGSPLGDLEIMPSINYTVNPAGIAPTYSIMYGGPASQLGQDAIGGIITTGDNIQGTTAGPLNPIRVETVTENDIFTFSNSTVSSSLGVGASETNLVLSHNIVNARVTAYEDDSFAAEIGILPSVNGFWDQFIAIPQNGATGATYNESVYISTLEGDINEVFPIINSNVLAPNKVTLGTIGTTAGEAFIGQIQVGQFMVRGFESVAGSGDYDDNVDPRTGTSRLTRVKAASYDGTLGSATYGFFIIETYDAMFLNPDLSGDATAVERYTSIDDFVDYYTVSALTGYTIPESAKPDGSNTKMNDILDVMYNTNIAESLADRDAITFRYLVDTFNNGIEPSSKSRWSKIAFNRQNAFAILNAPSVKEFKASTNPMFKFDSTSTFNPTYIGTGGNLALNPTNVYTLPSIADGANYCGFYTPNLRVVERGATKFVPPAASISNLYIDKYNLAQPWSIIAGPRRGVVSGTGVAGVEYEFDRRALDSIEPFGLNAIINKRGFGLVINANQTAQQTVKSALSQISTRELLIYIEDGIAEILKNYRWEFNTAQNRLEIKTLADTFMSQILNDGGLYDFDNVMDSTNNTSEVIDNNIGIIDTYVEPVRGMGILVNRVTILATGSIQAGNF
jgi:hypothetical protein